MTQPTPRTTWQDSDPYLEAIAVAAWEHCEKQHGIVIDDPRNIAEAVAATARAAVLREAADKLAALAENAHMEALSNDDIGHASGLENAANELRRMAEEARS